MHIYVHRNNQQLGPFSEAELKVLIQTGTLSLQDPVWWQGQAGWAPLNQTSLAASLTPPVPGTFAGVPGPHSSYARTSNLALWSMICGVSSFFCGITFIPAIILGHLGLSEIKKDPTIKGRGMALAGLIMGYVVLAIYLITVVIVCIFMALGTQSGDGLKKISEELKAAAKDDSSKNDDSDSSTNSAPSDSNTNNTPVITP